MLVDMLIRIYTLKSSKYLSNMEIGISKIIILAIMKKIFFEIKKLLLFSVKILIMELPLKKTHTM